MKPHDTFLGLAAAAIDFPLSPAQRGRLDDHLTGCAACRRTATALRGDAMALTMLPPVVLPERRAAELLDGILHPGAVRHPARLLVALALLGLVLLGSLAVGAELLRRMNDDDLAVVLPVPSRSHEAPTPVPDGVPSPSPEPSADPAPSGTLALTVTDPNGTSWIETLSMDDLHSPRQHVEGRDPLWIAGTRLSYTCLHPGWDTPSACTMDLGGGRTDVLSEAEQPVLGPDGLTLAVHRGMIDVGETWLVSLDGGNARRLAAGSFLQWSPDGTWLLGQPEAATAQVAVVLADGSDVPQILAAGYDPAWSPSGDRIAYLVVDGAGAKLRVMTPFSDVSETRYTAAPGSELSAPAWLPGGGIAFVMDGDLYLLDDGASEPERLTDGLAIRADTSANALAVAPDGRWIAFSSGEGASARVGIASVLGSVTWLPERGVAVAQPRWAPAAQPPTDEPGASPGASGSPDTEPLGTTWTEASIPTVAGRPVVSIEAVTAGGPGFVAVGRGCADTGGGLPECEGVVLGSNDGTVWFRAPQGDPTDIGAYFATSGPEIGMFDVAVGDPGIVAIGYAARPDMAATIWFSADDGASWERARIGDVATTRVNAIAWDGRQYVMVGEDRSEWDGTLAGMAKATARAAVWTSRDGYTFERVPHTSAFDVGDFLDTMEDPTTGGMADVLAGPSGLVAVGSSCTAGPRACEAAVWVSADGADWERVTGLPETSGGISAIAVSGTRLLAIGGGGVIASTDGGTWRTVGFFGRLRDLAVVGDRFFATTDATTTYASADGVDWTLVQVGGSPADTPIDPAEWHYASNGPVAVAIGPTPDTGEVLAMVSAAR